MCGLTQLHPNVKRHAAAQVRVFSCTPTHGGMLAVNAATIEQAHMRRACFRSLPLLDAEPRTKLGAAIDKQIASATDTINTLTQRVTASEAKATMQAARAQEIEKRADDLRDELGKA
jgi:hypothetical protein